LFNNKEEYKHTFIFVSNTAMICTRHPNILLLVSLFFIGVEAWNLATRSLSKPHIVSESYSRRETLQNVALIATSTLVVFPESNHAIQTIDVNNAMAREFTAFPGLYPTIATKIVNSAKDEPFKSKRDVYAILNEVEKERLKPYDKSIVISAPDKSLQQFKTSQICKYECGGRTSSSYRDEQIKSIQRARQQDY